MKTLTAPPQLWAIETACQVDGKTLRRVIVGDSGRQPLFGSRVEQTRRIARLLRTRFAGNAATLRPVLVGSRDYLRAVETTFGCFTCHQTPCTCTRGRFNWR